MEVVPLPLVEDQWEDLLNWSTGSESKQPKLGTAGLDCPKIRAPAIKEVLERSSLVRAPE